MSAVNLLVALCVASIVGGCADRCGYDTTKNPVTGRALGARGGRVGVAYGQGGKEMVMLLDENGVGTAHELSGYPGSEIVQVGEVSAAIRLMTLIGEPDKVVLFDEAGSQTVTLPERGKNGVVVYDSGRYVLVNRALDGMHLRFISEDGDVDADEVVLPVATLGQNLNGVATNDAGALLIESVDDDGSFQTYLVNVSARTIMNVATSLVAIPVWYDGRFRMMETGGRLTSISVTGDVEKWDVESPAGDFDWLIAGPGGLYGNFYSTADIVVADPTLHTFTRTAIALDHERSFGEGLIGFDTDPATDGAYTLFIREKKPDGSAGLFQRVVGTSGPMVHESVACSDNDT